VTTCRGAGPLTDILPPRQSLDSHSAWLFNEPRSQNTIELLSLNDLCRMFFSTSVPNIREHRGAADNNRSRRSNRPLFLLLSMSPPDGRPVLEVNGFLGMNPSEQEVIRAGHEYVFPHKIP
jgi:hypothetical protein